MERRTFMKGVGGLLSFALVPKIDVYGIPRWIIDACCDLQTCRYDLSKPFTQREFGFATDGRIALRLHDANKFAAEGVGKLPNVTQVFDEFWVPGYWQSWRGTEVESNESGVCLTCLGEMVVGGWTVCKECDGENTYITDQELKEFPESDWIRVGSHTDEYCGIRYTEVLHRKCVNGRIGVRCPECKGEGYDESVPHAVRIDGRLVGNKYFHLISKLPNAEFVPTRQKCTGRGDPSDAVVFDTESRRVRNSIAAGSNCQDQATR